MSPDPAGFELINPMDEDGEPLADGWPEGFGPGQSGGMRKGYSVIEALNWYSYVSNNPVKYVDPTGMETHIFSLTVTPLHRHLFIAVQDSDGEITTRGLYPESRGQAVKDIATGDTQGSEVRTNDPVELEVATKFFNGEKLPAGAKSEGSISPPSGMPEYALDSAVLESADSYPVDENPYHATRGPNSNTFVDDVIEGVGGVMPDVDKATQQNWGETSIQEND